MKSKMKEVHSDEMIVPISSYNHRTKAIQELTQQRESLRTGLLDLEQFVSDKFERYNTMESTAALAKCDILSVILQAIAKARSSITSTTKGK